MKRLAPHFSYANIVATLALFLVLTGGAAYAASHLGKNSVGTKQIKNGAVTPAKLSASAKATTTGAPGAQGPKGEPGSFPKILQSGESESGTFAAASNDAGGYWGITFTPPLAVALDDSHLHYLTLSDPRTATCPGPGQAAAGNLCVYASVTGQPFFGFQNPITNETGSATFGVVMQWYVETSTSGTKGNWTVTAP